MPVKAGEMETPHLMFTIIAFLLLGLPADVHSDKVSSHFPFSKKFVLGLKSILTNEGKD